MVLRARRLRPLVPATVLVALAAAAVLLAGRLPAAREARERAARSVSEVAARRAALAPRDRFGGPLRPAPFLSRGRPVAASRPGAEALGRHLPRGRLGRGRAVGAGAGLGGDLARDGPDARAP